ncbi:unnamed protein product [Oikopleura dioica]|uniref:RNA helicase n=1 Tax=Oikopleura dioica TaxID=34765 RepID=E4YE26_OIKDI|nr:unnamed protein product [Oikopleura dioica]
MSSTKTPTPSFTEAETKSGDNTTTFKKTDDSGSTSKFEKKDIDNSSKKESSSDSGSDDDNRTPAVPFGVKRPEKEEDVNDDKKRRGFRRDEYFQKKIAELREAKKRFILDLEYTYKHIEGLKAGEHVDPVYHEIYTEIKERKKKEREEAQKENVQVEEGDSADACKKTFGKSAEMKEAVKLTKKMTKTTDTTDESEFDENGNEVPKSSGKKKPEKPSVSGPGDENEDSDSSTEKDDETADKKPKKAFGQKSGEPKKGNKSFDATKDEGADEDDEVNKIRRRIEYHFDKNRLYSGHICHALEEDEVLHKNNDPGEHLNRIESLEFRITQAITDEIEVIPMEKYHIESYDEMNLHKKLKQNIDDYGWNRPLLVQRVVMRPIQECQDILINAQTGSGKSGAFLIPIINHILTHKSVIGIDPRALIMAPTRELAIQLAKECLKLCRKNIHLS